MIFRVRFGLCGAHSKANRLNKRSKCVLSLLFDQRIIIHVYIHSTRFKSLFFFIRCNETSIFGSLVIWIWNHELHRTDAESLTYNL